MTEIQQALFAQAEPAYADFQARLTPGLPREAFIGVRVPALRKMAATLAADPAGRALLQQLPHAYFEENMLHALLIGREKEYAAAIGYTEAFLPYVDNWAVCDCLSPRVGRADKPDLLGRIRRWAALPRTYTARFGLGMLMRHFLDGDFAPAYLEIPAAAAAGEAYYLQMMVAWFFATALAKQWPAALPYMAPGRLPEPVRRKAVQKACESFRLTPEQKERLRALR